MKSKPGILKSNTAVSETIGYSFILGIILISVGIMMVISYPILSNLKDSLFMETSLESFSMLDGRISMVAFGTTPSQPTRFDLKGGKITAQNDADNRLIIQKVNDSGGMEEIFNDTLGMVEFKVGDQKIGYENGGVFRKNAEGKMNIISPPEFYYNDGTLTFPIIKINSTASIGGAGIIIVNTVLKNRPVIKYPNNKINPNFTNPFDKNITIKLKSEYYEAWAEYIEEQTKAAIITTNASTQVVEVEIIPTDNIYLYVVEHDVNIDFH